MDEWGYSTATVEENIKTENKLNIKNILTGYLPGDKPILEELGIDLNIIMKESKLIFKSGQGSSSFLEKPDLTGPLVLLMLYSFILILNRKLHFGYIYFLSISSVLSVLFLFNMFSNNILSIWQCASVMGYSLGPVLFFGLLNLIIFSKKIQFFGAILFSAWSAVTVSNVLCGYLQIKNRYYLLIYPIFVFYFGFCCLSIL